MLQLQIQIQHCNLQSAMLVAPVCVPAKLEPCLATSPPLYKLHMILWTMVQLPFILPLEARVAFTPNLVPHYSTLPLSLSACTVCRSFEGYREMPIIPECPRCPIKGDRAAGGPAPQLEIRPFIFLFSFSTVCRSFIFAANDFSPRQNFCKLN